MVTYHKIQLVLILLYANLSKVLSPKKKCICCKFHNIHMKDSTIHLVLEWILQVLQKKRQNIYSFDRKPIPRTLLNDLWRAISMSQEGCTNRHFGVQHSTLNVWQMWFQNSGMNLPRFGSIATLLRLVYKSDFSLPPSLVIKSVATLWGDNTRLELNDLDCFLVAILNACTGLYRAFVLLLFSRQIWCWPMQVNVST